MSRRDLLRSVRRWWPAAILAFALVAGTSFAMGSAQTARYGATATLIFAVSGGDSATDLNQASTYLQREMTSYARVASSPRVLDPVVKALKLDGTAADLARNVEAVNPTNTVLLDITVSRAEPREAATLANTVAATLARVAESMAPSSSGRRLLKVTLLAPAHPPTAAAGLPRGAIVGLSLVLGAAAAALALIAAARWDRRVWRAADIDVELVGPVLASLARSTLPGWTDENTLRLRRAADELLSQRPDDRGALIALTSTAPMEEDVHLVTALGQAIADIGGRSAVLDISTVSAHEARIVMVLLRGGAHSHDPLSRVDVRHFGVTEAVTQLTSTELGRLRSEVDVILIHTPDMESSAVATTVMSGADAALLVVRAGTGERAVRTAIDRLTDASGGRAIPQVGIVLTRVSPSDAN